MNLERALDAWLSPGLIDAILVGVFAEWLVLRRVFGAETARRWRRPLGLYLGSGALLLLAVRFALGDGDRAGVAAALAAAFVVHLASLGSLRGLVGASLPAPDVNDRG